MPIAPSVINVDELEWGKVQRGRVNAVRTKQFPLDSGIPGVVLEFSYALIPDGYYTPRHRHSFDQIRLGLDSPTRLPEDLFPFKSPPLRRTASWADTRGLNNGSFAWRIE